jgi:hypothetical protein
MVDEPAASDKSEPSPTQPNTAQAAAIPLVVMPATVLIVVFGGYPTYPMMAPGGGPAPTGQFPMMPPAVVTPPNFPVVHPYMVTPPNIVVHPYMVAPPVYVQPPMFVAPPLHVQPPMFVAPPVYVQPHMVMPPMVMNIMASGSHPQALGAAAAFPMVMMPMMPMMMPQTMPMMMPMMSPQPMSMMPMMMSPYLPMMMTPTR